MAKRRRPSYVSIRARQRNLIEAFGSSQEEFYDVIADSLGVTLDEFRDFITTKPEAVRKQYNRRAGYQKLFMEDVTTAQQRKRAAQAAGVSRVRRFQFEEHVITNPQLLSGETPQEKQRAKVIGRYVQRLYYTNNIRPQHWSTYTFEHGISASPQAIVAAYNDGEISRRQFKNIVRTFYKDYPGTNLGLVFTDIEEDYDWDDYFASYEDEE